MTLKQSQVYTANGIQKNGQNIKNLLLRNPLPLANADGPTNSGILPQPEVMTALQSWTTAKVSQILWIHGLGGDKHRKSFENLVKVVVVNAGDFDVNTMYFSCNPHADEYRSAGNDEETHKRCLLDLTYVLIWQLIHILPDSVQVNWDFSTARFGSCNENYSSLKVAVGILQDLLEIAPPAAILIIVGIERLDHPSIEQDVKYILELLIIYSTQPSIDTGKETSTALNPNGTLKSADKALRLLFTTVKPCQPLIELHQKYEREMTQVLVSWKKWHQYGKEISLFSE